MNRAESERLEARFASHGYSPAACAEEADIIVVNSCVVRQHAEDKVVNKLYNLKTLKRDRPGLQAQDLIASAQRRERAPDLLIDGRIGVQRGNRMVAARIGQARAEGPRVHLVARGR